MCRVETCTGSAVISCKLDRILLGLVHLVEMAVELSLGG